MNDDQLPSSDRWTCEACGCYTNTGAENPMSCGVCGTRRVSNQHGRQRRGIWAIGGLENRNNSNDQYEDEEEVDMEEDDEMDSEMEHSDEDALNGNRVSSMRRSNDMLSMSDRLTLALNPSRDFGNPSSQAAALSNSSIDSSGLLSRAVASGPGFQPKWSPVHCSSSIKVEDKHQVACVGEGGSNGHCVRTSEAIPTGDEESSSIFGWRMVFEHPTREKGRNMGGCNLIGVVTDEFTDFSSRNALQQSRLFWGFDDNGRKYEGGNRRMAVALGSRTGGATRNSDNALFGAKEVVMIVVDLEAGTLNMWRDGRFLGVVVSGLPKNKNFFPIAVPFSPGVCVAITGVNFCPSVVMGEYLKTQQTIKDQKNELCRNALRLRRAALLTEGQLSAELKSVLHVIWTWYSKKHDDVGSSESTISSIEAYRLWYRSGLSLSRLRDLLATRRMEQQGKSEVCETGRSTDAAHVIQCTESVTFIDFLGEVQQVVDEQEEKTRGATENDKTLEHFLDSTGRSSHDSTLQVGDKVEVIEGYSRYGDASSGPLRAGDLGTVIEVQRGSRGDRQTVRVLYNGRRWWYQPQALVSERSGLVESPAVRLLVDLLRSHGYDSNLFPLWGKVVTVDSWRVGDLVVKLDNKCEELSDDSLSQVGVLSEASELNRRESGTVHVDFSDGGTARFNVSSLMHTTFYHGISILEGNDSSDRFSRRDSVKHAAESHCFVEAEVRETLLESEGENISIRPSRTALDVERKLAPITILDKAGIQSLLNDCKTKSSLARLFSAGLSDAILSGISLAREEGIEASSIASLGALCVAVSQQLFCPPPVVSEDNRDLESDASASDCALDETEVRDNNAFDSMLATEGSMRNVRNTLNSRRGQFISSSSVDLRELVRDLGIGPDQRRGVLLALMASERMHFDPRPFGRISSGGSEEPLDRVGHSLSRFVRLNAEAALGLPAPINDEEGIVPSMHPLNRPDNASEHVHAASWIPAQHTQNKIQARSRNPSTKALIKFGLLSDSPAWVKKFVSSGVDVKAQDVEGNSILFLAVCLGCKCRVIDVLLDAGFAVGRKEIQEAAYSGQAESLSLLLRQAGCTQGLVDLTHCSNAVVDVFEGALRRQLRSEDEMRESALKFGASLFWKFIELTLSFCVEGKESHLRSCINALVGDLLLQAICHGQSQASPHGDPSGDVVRNAVTVSSLAASVNSQSSHSADKPSIQIGNSLIEALPSEVIVASLSNDEARTSCLRLIEIHLWNKDINHSVVGLVLAKSVLRKHPSLNAFFVRYGVQELCTAHLNLAEERLLTIEQISSEHKSCVDHPIVRCPKGHVTVVHLTRHSSFKCDLCGKGVDQGKPMYGCRDCDWDACEKCTDKAEGGVVKWQFLKELADTCLEMLSAHSVEVDSGRDVLQRIVDGIKRRDPIAISSLGRILDIPGALTLYEFTSLILPALHSALLSNFEREECGVTKDEFFRTGHRKKKLRIGSKLRNQSRGTCSYIRDKLPRKCTSLDGDPFICALIMLLSTRENKEPEARSPERGSSVNEDDETFGEPLEDDALSRHAMLRRPESKPKKPVPQLLRMLHVALAFHERLTVTRHSSSEGGGELQSLLSVLEVELRPAQDCFKAVLPTEAGVRRVSCCDLQKNVVRAEVLLPIFELQQHIIRSCGIRIPSYLRYCRQLVQDRAIIADRGSTKGERSNCGRKYSGWRVARILGYDEATGAHVVRYASRRTMEFSGSPGPKASIDDYILEPGVHFIADQFNFDGRETKLVLAVREYCILKRHKQTHEDATTEQDSESNYLSLNRLTYDDSSDPQLAHVLLPGTRVECDFKSPDGFDMYTIVCVQLKENINQSRNCVQLDIATSVDNDSVTYTAVSDGGEILEGLLGRNIRHYDTMIDERRDRYNRRHTLRDETTESSSDLAVVSGSNSRPPHSASDIMKARVGALKRTWSALSTIQNMRPLELSGSRESVNEHESETRRKRKMSFETVERDDSTPSDCAAVEQPPIVIVELCSHDALCSVSVPHAARTTLFGVLNRLSKRNAARTNKLLSEKKCTLFYSVAIQWSNEQGRGGSVSPSVEPVLGTAPWIKRRLNESTATDADELHFSGRAHESLHELSNDVCAIEEPWYSLQEGVSARVGVIGTRVQSALDNCSGLNVVSVQCLQVITILADFYAVARLEGEDEVRDTTEGGRGACSPFRGTEAASDDERNRASIFVSEALTKKLLDQLEDPLSVVCGALPDWCRIAPAFASTAFSRASRRLLLDRSAFGVSRAVFCQQEAKVNVGSLRQRMASLRARAVELVTEAFSSDVDDPTALQLQADELYGMEEALNARVAAQFRAQGWNEHALESAKAAVRRDHLLADAAAVIDSYAREGALNRRRLEVRFEGESGFDAAAGDEAGVTRGFYADVAEALLSCDHVAGVNCPIACPSITQLVDEHSLVLESFKSARKLPLWIPDIDPSHKVIIPTPRAHADPISSLGVFPRPLGHNHPMRSAVLQEFRFIGRLFAAALRDRFIFPLPLSIAFLKLVQSRSCMEESVLSGVIESLCQYSITTSNSSLTSDHNSCASSAQTSSDCSVMLSESGIGCGLSTEPSGLLHSYPSLHAIMATSGCLESQDLPRPGFLGGEIYAVEQCICAALDNLEEMEPRLTEEELRQKRQEIARDKSFARKALGKSYDCSFEEYFEDRTFVDPLDPTQGESAYPLCPNGAQMSITVDNVREWVALAKQFVLHDGVIAQAEAFRRGVNDFFCADALLLLTPRELYEDVCGGGDNVDCWDDDAIRSLLKLDGGKGAAEALVAVAALGGDGGAALSRRFGPSSPTIGYLSKSLLEATPTQRRQFLSFVTSVPIVTPGKIEVVPVVSPAGEFLPMRDPGCMPRANTCARRLYLPKFESYSSFKQVFYSVIREESRFKGFYEWRG